MKAEKLNRTGKKIHEALGAYHLKPHDVYVVLEEAEQGKIRLKLGQSEELKNEDGQRLTSDPFSAGRLQNMSQFIDALRKAAKTLNPDAESHMLFERQGELGSYSDTVFEMGANQLEVLLDRAIMLRPNQATEPYR